MPTLHGQCHCGNLRIELHTASAPAQLPPRACDCGFCTRHGAAWVSDPHGRLDITVQDHAALGDYRQGANLARFLLCRHCGVLVAVERTEADGRFAAVNARCLDDAASLPATVSASPQRLAPDEKRERWRRLWIADVRWHSAREDRP